MTHVRPLRTTTRAARGALEARAGQAWAAWCDRFGLRANRASCTASDGVPPARREASAARHIGSDAWLLGDGGPLADAVASALFGAAALGTAPGTAGGATGGTVAQRVAEEALADLVAGLRCALAVDDEAADAPDAADTHDTANVHASWTALSRPWSGAVHLVLRADAPSDAGERVALGLVLAVGPRTVASAVPSVDRASCPATPRPALTPVWAALGPEPLRLEIHLDGLELDLGVLQSLRPGDVLPLSHDLARPLHAHLPLDATVDIPAPVTGAVHLGRRGAQRAVVPAAPFCLNRPAKVST